MNIVKETKKNVKIKQKRLDKLYKVCYNVIKVEVAKTNFKKRTIIVDKVDKICYSIKCKVNKQKTKIPLGGKIMKNTNTGSKVMRKVFG